MSSLSPAASNRVLSTERDARPPAIDIATVASRSWLVLIFVVLAPWGVFAADDESNGKTITGTAKPGESPPPVGAKRSVTEFERTWLIDLHETNVSVGAGRFGKGIAGYDGGAIHTNGISSHHGLGMRANGHVEYSLNKKYHRFRTSVAIGDSTGNPTCRAVEFRVLGDGNVLWKSAPFERPGYGQPCLLDVSSIDTLRLEAEFVAGSSGNEATAFAAWIEPYLSDEPVTAEALALYAPDRFNEHHDHEIEITKIRSLFAKENFAGLEELAKGFRSKEVFFGRWPMLFSFYQALEKPDEMTDEGWRKHFDRLERWQKSQPTSITPLVLLAEANIGHAWQARGNDIAVNVAKEAWPKFESGLGKAREYLEQAEKLGPDPEVYAALLEVAQGQGADVDKVIDLVETGRKLSVRYYPLYIAAAGSMLPQWSGDQLALKKFADRMKAEIGGDLADELYFRILIDGGDLASFFTGKTGMTYADVAHGIMVAMRNHPNDYTLTEYAAVVAEMSNDKPTARLLVDRIDPSTFARKPWSHYDQVEVSRIKLTGNKKLMLDYVPKLAQSDSWIGNIAFLGDSERLVSSGGGSALEIRKTDHYGSNLVIKIPVPPSVGGLAVDAEGTAAIVRWMPVNAKLRQAAAVVKFHSDGPPIQLTGHTGDILAVAIVRDGKRCATASADNTVRIWETESPEKPLVLKHPKGVVAVAFSPDGKMLATAGTRGTIHLWHSETGAELGPPLGTEEKDHLHCRLRFLPDGKKIIWSGKDGIIREWELASRKVREAVVGRDFITQIEVSPDGKWLAIGRDSGALDVMDLEALKVSYSCYAHYAMISGLAFSANGERLVSAALDGTLKMLDAREFESTREP